MPAEKRPFHEVISLALCDSSIEVIEALLDVLRRSKIKEYDAQKIAEQHSTLPATLKKARAHPRVVALAEEVLADLRGRKDEKKEEKSEPYVDTAETQPTSTT